MKAPRKLPLLALVAALGFGLLAEAQTRRGIWNGNPVMGTSQAAPTTDPHPEYEQNDTGCGVPPCRGQSKNVQGALHLFGCLTYHVILCADGGTLTGSGTVQIQSWPEFPVDAGAGVNNWSSNSSITETVTKVGQCQTFGGHNADGIGWIYPQPTSVGVTAGVVNAQIEAQCMF